MKKKMWTFIWQQKSTTLMPQNLRKTHLLALKHYLVTKLCATCNFDETSTIKYHVLVETSR